MNMTFVEDDGTEAKVEAEVGATLLEVAHENDIELEGETLRRVHVTCTVPTIVAAVPLSHLFAAPCLSSPRCQCLLHDNSSCFCIPRPCADGGVVAGCFFVKGVNNAVGSPSELRLTRHLRRVVFSSIH